MASDDDFKNLENTVIRHDGELDEVTKDVLELKKFIGVIVLLSPGFLDEVRSEANKEQSQSAFANPQPIDTEFRDLCRRFVQEYDPKGRA